MKLSKIRVLSLISLSVVLSSCATQYPEQIDQKVNANVTVKDIQSGVKVDNGFVIRWGGVIANINNHQKETWLEVVQLPLAKNGEPKQSDKTDGRFLVKINAFLDPAIYAKGRGFTVVGALSGVTKGKIGEHDYQYPVVNAKGYVLWPERKEVNYQTLYYPVGYWDPYFSFYFPRYHYRHGYYHNNSSSGDAGRSSDNSSTSRVIERRAISRPPPRQPAPVTRRRQE